MFTYLKRIIYLVLLVVAAGCSKDEAIVSEEASSLEISTDTNKICEAKGAGKLYEVGPGKAYENIIDVPTEDLGPGDAIRIYAKESSYKERIIISTKGTEEEPICICGVPDENGKLPILEGKNSRVRPINLHGYFNENTAYSGMIVIHGTYDNHPEYIKVSNLQLQGANQYMQDDSQKSYIMGTDDLKPFSRGASGVYMRGAHIEVNNCVITHNGNGIFGAYNEAANALIDVKLNNNIITENGTYNVDQQHNIYIEAEGLVSIGNQFGPIREGAKGTNYKSRSAGDIIMYNRFVGPAGRLVNLAETENAAAYFPQLPSYKTTIFAGNILEGSPVGSYSMLHYGHDNVDASSESDVNRKGTLHCYNNTFILKGKRTTSYRKLFFDLTFCEAKLNAFNNILYFENDSSDPDSEISIFRYAGTPETFSNNLITSATIAAYNTKLIGVEQLACGSNSLLFEDLSDMLISDASFALDVTNNYKLTANSSAIDAGKTIPANVKNIEYQFKFPNGIEARQVNGSAIDIGAFEL